MRVMVMVKATKKSEPMPGEEAEIEIRPIFEAEAFGEDFAREKAERMREVERRTRS